MCVATSARAVSAAEDAGTGYWSQWIDADPFPQYGTGEFERCSRIFYTQDRLHRCLLGCEAPIAARYSLVDERTTATWTDIGMSIGEM